MSQLDTCITKTSPEQVYLIERDAGLLCRILGLYAARSIDVSHVEYGYAAHEVMALRVKVFFRGAEACDTAESVRVLVAKVSTLVGVIAAAEQPEATVHRHEEVEV